MILIASIGGGLDCAALVDTNTNGMSDVWEAAYSAWDIDPELDADGDGRSNLAESISGTDPFDATSVLRIESSARHRNATLVRWQSVAGKRYQVEGSGTLPGEDWQPAGEIVTGTGGEVMAAVPQTSPPFADLRLRVVVDNPAVIAARPFLEGFDSDGDGVPDIDEFAAGTNPFETNSLLQIRSITNGHATVVRWTSVPGKHYQIETSPDLESAQWVSVPGILKGTGATMSATLSAGEEPQFWRVRVFDQDDDFDGLSDWEEQFLGLDRGPWHYRTNYPSDLSAVTDLLAAPNVINVNPGVPVANMTRDLPGSFEVTRQGNVSGLTVNYTVGGDAVPGVDYVALPGSVKLPPGSDSVTIPVVPMAGAEFSPSRTITLTLQPGEGYSLGSDGTTEVRALEEVALSVTDFGAVGDGFVDDTAAIQAAIDALEASSNHNTLHFPAGTYRLNSPVFDSSTAISQHRLLRLGVSDLAGRDLIFRGASGATLYSTVSHVRAQMLLAHASFRSLAFYDLIWKKDDNPLPASPGGSPAGASGVTIALRDLRRVESVDFTDCTFDNCHSAIVTTFKNGYDTRGRLAHFNFRRSRVLNPFGSNTTDAQTAFGGGQQISLSPWVGTAVYAESFFVGGPDGPADPEKNPGGIRKDGSHFGSPLRLIFTNNVVRNMEFEAVFQTDESSIGVTAASFEIPPGDGTTTAKVAVFSNYSTYVPGQILNFRVGFIPGATPFNALLTVTDFEPSTWTVTVVNTGLSTGIEGVTFPAVRDIYLQTNNPTIATISGNVIANDNPSQAGDMAIASNSRATIYENFLHGYIHGVHLYDNVRSPLTPPTPGTWIHSNVIVPHNSSAGLPLANGIISYGPEEIISDNLILAPSSVRFTGVAVQGRDAWIENNTVTAISISHAPYDSFSRSVGIGAGNPSRNSTSVGNRTREMDVGNGPWSPHQIVPRRVISHFSYDDVLSIDHRGLTE